MINCCYFTSADSGQVIERYPKNPDLVTIKITVISADFNQKIDLDPYIWFEYKSQQFCTGMKYSDDIRGNHVAWADTFYLKEALEIDEI